MKQYDYDNYELKLYIFYTPNGPQTIVQDVSLNHGWHSNLYEYYAPTFVNIEEIEITKLVRRHIETGETELYSADKRWWYRSDDFIDVDSYHRLTKGELAIFALIEE